MSGKVTLERTGGASGGFALGNLLVVIDAAGARGHPDLDHRDGVERRVQLPVPVTRQPVTRGISARNLNGCGAGVVRVCGGRGKPARGAGAAQQTGGQDSSDAVDLAKRGAVFV